MFLWKSCFVVTTVALLATNSARAEDSPAVIGAGSAQVEAAPAKSEAIPGDVLINDVEFGNLESDYWLGVFASRPSPALQAQLKLPKDQGLLVEDLRPESPAAKAGLQPYDVLLKGNDKPLSNVDDLMRLIGQVKEGKLKLDLLRRGNT